ncbi:MAG: hypothetical protein KGD63_14270 [Candidatus Lokiarchaeota archaeon]|nr:hypothetical protein [Candidatus Lokiarchaeota archaeon]
MQILISRPKYQVYLENSHKKILNHLQIGTFIPILPKFRNFLIRTFKNYDVKAILLVNKENHHLFRDNGDNVVGLSILFNDDPDVLFFGYFGAYDHNPYKINLLINELKKYAKKNNFKKIVGPVNIPVIIFGFGLMEEGSNKQLCTNKPINPPIYQRLFFKNGFYVKYIEETYYTRVIRCDPNKISGSYDFSEFEYINIIKENLHLYLNDMIKLHKNNMPSYSKITPNTEKNVHVLFDYLFSYKKDFLIWVIKHKPTERIIACGHLAPNPFLKDKHGRLLSASIEHVVIEKDFQGRGLSIFMYCKALPNVINPKRGDRMKYYTNSIGIDNKRAIEFVKKYINGIRDRRHLILEYKLN